MDGSRSHALLNAAAHRLVENLLARGDTVGIRAVRSACGALLVDCGVSAPGGEEAGVAIAEIAMAGLGRVRLEPAGGSWTLPMVAVESESPVAACLASQYAGWKVQEGRYFAMASGPIRAAIGREELFDRLAQAEPGDLRERPSVAVGLLESAKLPPDAVCLRLADEAGVDPAGLILLVARTASAAGTLQVVARSLETALHKLDTLGFDIGRIVRGGGRAPLPPVPLPADDLEAIGRTNDCILYGGEVVLEIIGDEPSVAEIGPLAVSGASPAHGRPFRTLFEEAGGDFYAIDPALFAPAVLEVRLRDSGRSLRFGGFAEDVLTRSLGTVVAIANHRRR
jgi:methenyltetrahydromethanopterin cyclohydrolase